jgi:hypothetical protein
MRTLGKHRLSDLSRELPYRGGPRVADGKGRRAPGGFSVHAPATALRAAARIVGVYADAPGHSFVGVKPLLAAMRA